jgi:hypothetical protein
MDEDKHALSGIRTHSLSSQAIKAWDSDRAHWDRPPPSNI